MRALIFLLTSLLASASLAGPRVNNGGGAYRCRDAKTGEAKWIKPVDLFEAGGEFHLDLPGDAWQIYGEKLREIHTHFPRLSALIKKHHVDLKSAMVYSPTQFEATSDSDISTVARIFANRHCDPKQIRYVQVANYLIDGTLMISKPVWDNPAFTEYDKAVLLVHEMIYKALRSEGDEPSSRRTRVLTGIIFSKKDSIKQKNEQIEQWLTEKYPKFLVIPFSDTTALFRVRLWCWVGVTEYGHSPAKDLGKQTFKDMQLEFNQTVEMAGFRIQIKTNGIDGVPTYLRIEDTVSKTASERKDGLTTQFLKDKTVSHSFSRLGRYETVATVRCTNDVDQ